MDELGNILNGQPQDVPPAEPNAGTQQPQDTKPQDPQPNPEPQPPQGNDGKDGDDKQVEEISDLYKGVAHILNETGVLKLKTDEITEDNFKEVLSTALEQERQKTLETVLSSLPSEVVALVKYSLQGGNPRDMLPLLLQEDAVVPEVNESNAKMVVQNYLKQKGLGDTEVEVIIKSLEQDNKLVDRAKQYNEDIKKNIEQQKAETIKQQEEARRQQEEQVKQFVDATIKSATEFGIDQNQVAQFITVPVSTEGNMQMTQFEVQLQKLYSDPQLFSKLVYWAMNDFKDDIFVKKAKAKVSKDVMEKLNNIGRNPVNNQHKQDNQTLLDFLGRQ